MVMAGGDGSLITHLMNAKKHGVNLETLVCCPLPFGTGNDFGRVTGWGGTPTDFKFYKTLKSLMTEVCLNSYVDDFDVWDIRVNFQNGGDLYTVDSKTRRLAPMNEPNF
jgi:hypothetical protein